MHAVSDIPMRGARFAVDFALPPRCGGCGAIVEGRHVILVDGVLTSGSTSEACAKALLNGGASQVDLRVFARVVRPSQLAR